MREKRENETHVYEGGVLVPMYGGGWGTYSLWTGIP